MKSTAATAADESQGNAASARACLRQDTPLLPTNKVSVHLKFPIINSPFST